jgi:hypothetical protein
MNVKHIAFTRTLPLKFRPGGSIKGVTAAPQLGHPKVNSVSDVVSGA